MVNENWYDDGLKKIINDLVEYTGVDSAKVLQIYSYLVNSGFIDYDIEKDLFWDMINGEEE